MTMDADDALHKIMFVRQKGLEYFDSVKRLEAGYRSDLWECTSITATTTGSN